MADSKRLKTLKRLCDYLKSEVTTANGYPMTLAAVSRGQAVYGDEFSLPHVAVSEALNPDRDMSRVGAEEGVQQKEGWVILLQGWVEDDANNPTDPAYELMAAVKKAIAKIDNPRYETSHPLVYSLGGLVLGIEVEPGTVRPPEREISAKAFFWMRVILKFYEDVNDPFDYGRSFVPDPPTP